MYILYIHIYKKNIDRREIETMDTAATYKPFQSVQFSSVQLLKIETMDTAATCKLFQFSSAQFSSVQLFARLTREHGGGPLQLRVEPRFTSLSVPAQILMPKSSLRRARRSMRKVTIWRRFGPLLVPRAPQAIWRASGRPLPRTSGATYLTALSAE